MKGFDQRIAKQSPQGHAAPPPLLADPYLGDPFSADPVSGLPDEILDEVVGGANMGDPAWDNLREAAACFLRDAGLRGLPDADLSPNDETWW